MPANLYDKVCHLLDRGETPEVIAEALECSVQRVLEYRSRWRHRDQFLARCRRYYEDERLRFGFKTVAEHRAAQRTARERRLAQIQPLLDRGLSWRQAAAKLGISHNVIAGLTYRARQANKQGNTA